MQLLKIAILFYLSIPLMGADDVIVELRGVGKIHAVVSEQRDDVCHLVYITENPIAAQRLASKRLADLCEFGDFRLVHEGGSPGTILESPSAGWWMLATEAASVHEVCGANRADVVGQRGVEWRPVETGAYPRWMDAFDNAAFGFWSLGGGVLPQDLDADLRWIGQNRFAMCAVGVNEDRVVSPGVLDTSIIDFYRAKANEFDIPWRMLLGWNAPQRPRYTWNEVPLPHVSAAGGGVSVDVLFYQKLAAYCGFEPIPATDMHLADSRRLIANRAGMDPNFIGHHGTAEVPRANPMELAGVSGSSHVRELWIRWLRLVCGYSLEQVGERYRGNKQYFRSWDDVAVPLMSVFVSGVEGGIDLRGDEWQARFDSKKIGIDGHWYMPGEDGEWINFDVQDPMILLSRRGTGNNPASVWFRRHFTLDSDGVAKNKYLHLGRTGWHGNVSEMSRVWINGIPLKCLSETHPVHPDLDQCFSVGQSLRPGRNLIVIDGGGTTLSSYVLLSNAGRWLYPSSDQRLNALWFDSTEFIAWLRLAWIGDCLAATRRGDEFRPQKIMAPWEFVAGALDLGEKYGAYVHETGMGGSVWCPWMPRYAQSRQMPASSEPGAPPKDVFSFAKMVTNYLMMGDEAVDVVFHADLYRTNPGLSGWIASNRELIRCIGKSVVPISPVAVLRSTRAVRLGQEAPWSWDISRGELQTVGRDAVDLEIEDFVTGRIDPGVAVVVDAGTTIMTENEVEMIGKWVRAGGIFVAQHVTGRHAPEMADAWPIEKLTGMRVVDSAVRRRRMFFSEAQTIWPRLAGCEISGSGSVLDWLDKDRTGASVAYHSIAEGVEAVATWEGPGNDIAIGMRRLGKGRVVALGSTFWRNARDANGRYIATDGARPFLDDMMRSLGVPRVSSVSTVEGETIFAFRWKSKNGIYDVYPVARMNSRQDAPMLRADVEFNGRRDRNEIIELSASGHPVFTVKGGGNGFTLSGLDLAAMQSRVFAMPRSDLFRAGLDWLAQLARRWPVLPAVDPAPVPTENADVIPLAEGWRVSAATEPWGACPLPVSSSRVLRLGSYSAMGMNSDAILQAWRHVSLPAGWDGKRLRLVFSAEEWFWGIGPKGRLWINGQLAPIRQPIVPDRQGSFVIDLGECRKGFEYDLALEIDGRVGGGVKRPRPAGVTGIFYFEALPPIRSSVDLIPLLRRIDTSGRLGGSPDIAGEVPLDCVSLQSLVPQLPKRADCRLFLEWNNPLEYLQVGKIWLEPPAWMRRLDVSRLLNDGGATIVRVPPSLVFPREGSEGIGRHPEFRIVWTADDR